MKLLRRVRWSLVGVAALFLVLVVGAYGWTTESGYFALLPDNAHPAANVVHAPGGKPPADGSGFYFVDVNELQANLIQKLWAEHLVEGAQLVPDNQVLAPGQSDQEHITEDARAMTNSQQTAQVVAERALGKQVPIEKLGAQLLGIQPGDPAAKAGLKPGDIVTAANGRPVHTAGDLIRAMQPVKPGQLAHLTLKQAGNVTVGTIASTDHPPRALIGVSIGDAVHVGHIPIPVRFSTGSIGGPSAGLAFALEIYDSLSGRHLLRGHKIAVTGELDLAGGVHEIGGVTQKTIGAINAGADTFLVPAGDNFKDARRTAHGRIHVIAVTGFDQALSVIRGLPPR
jgi:PDZ domain-containing protein